MADHQRGATAVNESNRGDWQMAGRDLLLDKKPRGPLYPSNGAQAMTTR